MAKGKDLIELERQAEFQRKKLSELLERLESEPMTLEYYTATGNTRYCENPEWAGYEKLLKSYHATLRAISAQTGGKPSEKRTGIGSPLMNFRDKYQNISAVRSA